jgi:hemoglobin
MKRSGFPALVLAASMIVAAAASAPALSQDLSLYQKFGEKPGIDRIAADVTDRWVADPRIGETFDNINLDRFKRLLADQFCELVGGPCKYTGRDMYQSHKGLHLNAAEFNALAEDLQYTMEKFGIPYWAQNRLMVLLAPMAHDIVIR